MRPGAGAFAFIIRTRPSETAVLFFCFYFYLFSRRFVPGAHEIFEFGHEFSDVLESQVDGCKPYIGNIIERLKTFHYDLSDLAGLKFAIGSILHVSLDLVDDRLKLSRGYGTFFTGAQQARHYLVPLECLALTIFFDDHVRDLVDPLVRREPAGTIQAFAAAADRIPVFRLARIDDLIFKMSAKRAAHNL